MSTVGSRHEMSKHALRGVPPVMLRGSPCARRGVDAGQMLTSRAERSSIARAEEENEKRAGRVSEFP
jgi:hypothetical protein